MNQGKIIFTVLMGSLWGLVSMVGVMTGIIFTGFYPDHAQFTWFILIIPLSFAYGIISVYLIAKLIDLSKGITRK